MGTKRPAEAPTCQVCKKQVSKYKCPACPIRYCSVACYKEHKLIHENPSTNLPQPSESIQDTSAPILDIPSTDIVQDSSTVPQNTEEIVKPSVEQKPLKPLTSLSWPPEPDSSIFTDPLQKEDPKPLRREELLRIATSSDLRTLLTQPNLPKILRIIDTLPTKNRHIAISKLLSIDSESLSNPNGITESFLSGRNSPPPLEELLSTLSGENKDKFEERMDGNGWWLFSSKDKGEENRIWIGEEERNLFKLFSNAVCTNIDGENTSNGNGGEGVVWGKGNLEWEV